MARYEEGGPEALQERSHQPHHVPHQIPAHLEARALELRRLHPGLRLVRLQHQLGRESGTRASSHMATHFVRHRIVDVRQRRKRLPDHNRWERDRPMELWQMDVVGGVLLTDGTRPRS